MSVSAHTASTMARNEPPSAADTANKLSFAYCSFVLSVLFNLFFNLFSLCTLATFIIASYQSISNTAAATAALGPDNPPTAPSFPYAGLIFFCLVSFLVDLLYFGFRLHNRARSPYATGTYAAYFREKPAALFRLCNKSPHHRRLYFRWQGALQRMLLLDVLAVLCCVLPVHACAKPSLLYQLQALDSPLSAYNYVLTFVATVLEAALALELLLEFVRRWCGPEYPDVLLWHPQTGNLTPVQPHQYHEALLQHQHTPPSNVRPLGLFVPPTPASPPPSLPPPAYGHQDAEDALVAAAPQPHTPSPRTKALTYRQHVLQQRQQEAGSIHQQPYYAQQQQQQQQYMQPYVQYAQAMQRQQWAQQQHYARARVQQVAGEERAEGQSQEGKVDAQEGSNRAVQGGTGAEGGEYAEAYEVGEEGADTAPLVMLMSPALMGEDDAARAAAADSPRVMLHVRPSDADKMDSHT